MPDQPTKRFAFRILSPEYKAELWKKAEKGLIITGVIGAIVGGIVVGAVLPLGTAAPGKNRPLKQIVPASQMVIR